MQSLRNNQMPLGISGIVWLEDGKESFFLPFILSLSASLLIFELSPNCPFMY